MQNFLALGAPPPDPVPLAAGGPTSRPQNSPPLRISGYVPGHLYQLSLSTARLPVPYQWKQALLIQSYSNSQKGYLG